MYGPRAIIHLGRLVNNYRNIQEIVGNAKVMSIVKADGYGHGMIQVSKALAAAGAHAFGVAALQEALDLRESSITNMIVHLGRLDPNRLEMYIKHDIRLTIQDATDLDFLSVNNKATGAEFTVHLKIDTGMGRLGVPYEQALDVLERIAKMKFIHLEGICSHFATADEEDQSYLRYQLVRFAQFVHNTRKMALEVEYFHTANSSAIINDAESHFNMVRPGLLLFGVVPSENVVPPFIPEPVMDLEAPLILKKDIRKGMPVGYGREFRSTRDTRVGTLQIGYADGLLFALGGKHIVEIAGKKYDLIGRISMDTCNIDLGKDDPDFGEQVLIWGHGSDNSVRVEEIAKLVDTSAYELLVRTGTRVERIYVED